MNPHIKKESHSSVSERGASLGKVLLVAMLICCSSALPAEHLVLGNPADTETARSLGLPGRYVAAAEQISDGSNVIVLGSKDRDRGIDDIDFLNLVGRNCEVIRLSEGQGGSLQAVVKTAAERIQQGNDPFKRMAREIGCYHHPGFIKSLAKSSGKSAELKGLANKPQARPVSPTVRRALTVDPLAPPIQNRSPLGARLDTHDKVVLFLPFESEKAAFTPRSDPFLYSLLELLFSRPSLRLTISGHAESSGGADAALRLAEARAQAVKDWLVNFGISASRLKAVGSGATRPLQFQGADPGMTRVARIEIAKEQ